MLPLCYVCRVLQSSSKHQRGFLRNVSTCVTNAVLLATIACTSKDLLLVTLTALDDGTIKIVRGKMRFDRAMDPAPTGGYRDCQLLGLILVDGMYMPTSLNRFRVQALSR